MNRIPATEIITRITGRPFAPRRRYTGAHRAN